MGLAWGTAMNLQSDPLQNRLLAALPDTDWRRWRARLEFIEMPLGHTLAEAGAAQPYVWFPTTAVVSLLYLTESGHSAEIAVVGTEGMVGLAPVMGGDSTPQRAAVLVAGQGYRSTAEFVRDEFERSVPIRHLLLRFAQAKLVQIGQTAVCNRFHSIDQQLCRWLLLCMDRLPGDTLAMTQELIAHNLGVRREGVTEAAIRLQNAGLIRYARGRISVLGRKGLERSACECYGVVKDEYDRLLHSECEAPRHLFRERAGPATHRPAAMADAA
ncbi:MAG: Crp/Fnr family transcriptional regulator [Rubrivivax sp. SCN 70-15]|nr:MAG: Crp/Fnr family transcriptional regulator [Rubrivivax sp. SCN 70-15]